MRLYTGKGLGQSIILYKKIDQQHFFKTITADTRTRGHDMSRNDDPVRTGFNKISFAGLSVKASGWWDYVAMKGTGLSWERGRKTF
jgi:hypothetical protein